MAVTQRTSSTVSKAAAVESSTPKDVDPAAVFTPPQYSIKELLGAIPAECFERSGWISSIYIAQDVAFLAAFATGASYISTVVEAAGLSHYASKALSFALWNLYWLASGFAATGLWIIAHECGHQAFSPSKTVNNAVGWVLHSALLVPYHSWRISHGRHHASTGHISRDEVFVPRTRDQLNLPAFDEAKEDYEGFNVTKARQLELQEAIGDAPLFVLLNLLAQQLFGWPMYLIRNASGQKHYPKFTNHFDPSSIIFDKSHRNQILVSDLGIAIIMGILGTWTYYRSFSEVAAYYLIPYLYVNHWLVSITFLQHTDPFLPHYSNNNWNFAKGALATIDRNCLGFVGPIMLHGICETHIAHHLSSRIPHHNAWKATAALKEFLGKDYQYRDDNFLVALYRTFRDCRFIEHGPDVVFFKNANGVAKMQAAPSKSGQASDSGVDVESDSSK